MARCARSGNARSPAETEEVHIKKVKYTQILIFFIMQIAFWDKSWGIFGRFLGDFWQIFGGFLGDFWGIFGRFLALFLALFLADFWPFFGPFLALFWPFRELRCISDPR
jgi:hypothetical protein